MKVELKAVHVVARMSQETTCFVAAVYLDGKRAGVAENLGHGGETLVRIADHDLRRRLEDAAPGLCRPISLPYGDELLPPTGHEAVAWLIDQLLGDHLERKARR